MAATAFVGPCDDPGDDENNSPAEGRHGSPSTPASPDRVSEEVAKANARAVSRRERMLRAFYRDLLPSGGWVETVRIQQEIQVREKLTLIGEIELLQLKHVRALTWVSIALTWMALLTAIASPIGGTLWLAEGTRSGLVIFLLASGTSVGSGVGAVVTRSAANRVKRLDVKGLVDRS